MSSSNSNTVKLTSEQKQRIEANRKEALERLKARNLQNPKIPSSNSNFSASTSKILPTKTTNQRVNPYLKPQSNNKQPPQTFKQNHPLVNKPLNNNSNIPSSSKSSEIKKKAVVCTFEVISDERFLVRMNAYDVPIIEVFKKIPSKIYHSATKQWSFNFRDHDQIVKELQTLSNVSTVRIPDFVVKHLMAKTEIQDETCLDQIESTLVDSLLDFQRSGVCYGISKQGRCLIADDMGLGKSRQAIGIADFYKHDWPLLIITNASTRQFWANELEKLLPYLRFNDIKIFHGVMNIYGTEKVFIGSYKDLQGRIDELLNLNFGIIIFDESHNIKNPKAKQTQNAELLSKKAHRIIMLSGTPALSRPVELFPQLKILDNNFASYTQFTARYCDGKQTQFGWTANGSSYLNELDILLRKKFLIRRIKSDVFNELSAKNRKLVILDKYRHTIEFDCDMQEFKHVYEAANVNKKEAEEILMKWYHSTSEIKAYAACVFVKKYLECNDCKVIVFVHHAIMMNAVCAELEKANYSYVKIDGKTKGDVRAEQVEAFQNNPRIRAAVLSIRSCNAGITLTAASTVIFCEFDWNPSTITQAEARAHRIGQENEVKIYFLIAKETVDEVIWNLLLSKQKNLGKAGLMANVENLGQNVETLVFDVQENKFINESQSKARSQNESQNVKQNNQNKDKVDYFEDDMDDDEIYKLVENLP